MATDATRRLCLLGGAASALGVALGSRRGLAQAAAIRSRDAAGTLRRVVATELTSLDPQRPTGIVTTEMAAELFEGLSAYDAAGRIVPGCAEAWRTSEDGLRWTFRLRPNLRWSDGVPLTAADFVCALRRFVTPVTGAQLASRLDGIRGARELRRSAQGALGVSATDARTVVIELIHPEPQLPVILAPVYCVPRHVAEGNDQWARPETIVTNGPYRLEFWAPGAKEVRLRRNERFHGAANVRIARVDWLTGYDATSRLRLFRVGECDLTAVEDAVSLASARADLGVCLRSSPAMAMGWIGLNVRRKPLDDVRVRRALALALDRAVLAGRVRALSDRPSDAMLPPGLDDQPNPQQPEHVSWPMAQRLARARELMQGAGFAGPRRAKLGIGFPVPNPAAQRFYLAVAAMWRAIGVDVELQPLEGRAYNAALMRGQFDVFSFNTYAPVPLATQFLDRFESASSINYCGYRSVEFDRAFAAATRETTADGVASRLAAAERLLLRDQPVVPVYHTTSHRLVAARVGGWSDHPGPLRPSRFLTLA